jgi:ParB family chromosome partitioning protein
VGQFRLNDSVGETPTDAVETTALPGKSPMIGAGIPNHWRYAHGFTRQVGQFRLNDSVGETPTDAVETTALPQKVPNPHIFSFERRVPSRGAPSAYHFFPFPRPSFARKFCLMAKPILGRGLNALLGGSGPGAQPVAAGPMPSAETVQAVPVARIRASPLQPRRDFSAESLRELADSIKEQGIVQPLILRLKDDHYELIAGERRWRAAQMLGLPDVPAIVRQADDRAVLELALIENLQRENLNPIEEAGGYAQLIEQFNLTQEEAAAKVGKSRVVVANALRLLKLAPELQVYVREARLSVGHAKVILGLASEEEQRLAATRVLKKSLNVRQTEELVAFLQHQSGQKSGARREVPPGDAHLASLQNRLQERFGTKVRLRYHQGKGAVEIQFFNDGDLERVLKLAGIELE